MTPLKTIKKTICILLLLAAAAFQQACLSDKLYDKNKPVDKKWRIGDFKKFDVTVTDTISLYKFYLSVRNSSDYKYTNLYLLVTTTYPDSRTTRDTAEVILAGPDGRWKGTGMGDVKDNLILFKKDVRFPQKGTYSFYIEHGMYDKELEGITDVGIRIEK